MADDAKTDLALPDEMLLVAAFAAPENMEPILARIEAEVRAHVPDLTTKKGRDAIASLAYKVARSKTTLDAAGKRLTEDIKKKTAAVDAERNKMRDRLDKLRDQTRAPLNEWEAAEATRLEALRLRMAVFSLKLADVTRASADLIKDEALASETIVDASWGEAEAEAAKAKLIFLETMKATISFAVGREKMDAELARLRADAAERQRKDQEAEAATAPRQQAPQAEDAESAPQAPARETTAPSAAPAPRTAMPSSGGPKVRVIDYETTGTPEDSDAEICEMGRVDLDPTTGIISNEWESLVCPRGAMPPQARAIHHISDNDLTDAPILRDVLDDFMDGFQSGDVMAAHNAEFEKHFTPDKNLRWVCTYKCARVVWPDAPGHSNQCLRYWLCVDEEGDFEFDKAMPPHSALPDAYTTAFILRHLLKHKSLNELVKISTFPALLTKLTFGKHKGMAYADAPADYLEWIRDKSDMDADTKFSARYWLQKRNSQSDRQAKETNNG